MTTWTSGYVADVAYTFGYYPELNPARVRLAFANAGLVFPEVGAACELGFGQGLSANFHAAASTASWWGTDFNPSQAGFAQSLAQASGAEALLFDEAFAEFCSRPDLPDFDYISLHGIWSWISDENRAVIVDFVRRKLKVGGVLYISYNTLPGWAAFAPMRHLMTEHAEVLGSEGRGILSRVDGAIEFAEKLLATNPIFSRANPPVGERLKKMKGHNRHYVAHEYFNRDWHPMHFATMAEWLDPAKVQYACSANFMDAIDAVNLTAEQQAFLNEIPDPMFRQSVRDFMVNQQFRRDYWVKGIRRMAPLEQAQALNDTRVVLNSPRADVPLKANGSLGEVSLNASVYTPILDLMADYQPRTVAELEAALKDKGVSRGSLMQAVMMLAGAGHFSVAQTDAVSASARKTAAAANRWIMQRAQGSGELAYLASPVTGGAVPVGRFPQLFAQALLDGKATPQDQAQSVWDIISAQGQRIVKEGKPLATPEENLAELTTQAQTFADSQLPLLRGLGVV